MNIKKIVHLLLGVIGVILGVVGAVFPMIPSVPFLLLAAYGFAKSSNRLHAWFIGTKMYQENLESYVEKKGMTKKAKLRIIGIVTITMAIGFIFMSEVPIGRVCLAVVWIVHMVYFCFGIKTIEEMISENVV